MNICVLGSTSKGNATLVWNETEALLVDCGLSYGYTSNCLENLSVPFSLISSVIVTHCHGDHVSDSMVKKLIKLGIPILCHTSILNHLRAMSPVCRDACDAGMVRTFDNAVFTVGFFSIQSFPVVHDAPGGCFGFNINEKRNDRIVKCTMATDVGSIDETIIARFLDSHVLVLESNYDPEMLDASARQTWLKKRIRKSHLSNGECSDLLFNVLAGSLDKPSAVILTHLSEECNSPEKALAMAGESIGDRDIPVIIAEKNKMTKVVTV